MAGLSVFTPSPSRKVHLIELRFTSFDPLFKSPTSRLLFRKLGKALDDRISSITAAELKVQQLIAALERAHLEKRRKVVPDLNEVFVAFKRVREVKGEMEQGLRAPRAVTRRIKRSKYQYKPVQMMDIFRSVLRCLVLILTRITSVMMKTRKIECSG